ncbi:MAG: RnfABCDGE type electron transport complex subunit D [Oscillospiraceae bacterium]|nr:RnfABCDGE type electron transport complex subunit D [Oscillospiraceae bacterium]
MSYLAVSPGPHIRGRVTTQGVMRDVLIALVPALIAGTLAFGLRAILITAVCVASCVLSEYLFEKGMKRPVTIGDLSACVTGVLLAYNLPVGIPIWQAVFGSAVAIIVIKQLFGGLGKNFANPAITARIVMFLAFSATMSTWVIPNFLPDAVTSATPLALLRAGDAASLPSLLNMLLGQRGGCIGETSALALTLGGVYLIARRVITWHAPVAFIAMVFAFTAVLGREPVYQIFSGGLFLGAIFMATDYVTTPRTTLGRIIFGLGAGFITVVIRAFGSYPEGVSFAILLMNILTPYINKATETKPIGGAQT